MCFHHVFSSSPLRNGLMRFYDLSPNLVMALALLYIILYNLKKHALKISIRNNPKENCCFPCGNGFREWIKLNWYGLNCACEYKTDECAPCERACARLNIFSYLFCLFRRVFYKYENKMDNAQIYEFNAFEISK